nr:transposase [Arthrobacter sp. Alg241-R88]
MDVLYAFITSGATSPDRDDHLVDLDTGQVLGIVDGRDSEGVGDWPFARLLQWRLGVQVVAIDPSAAVRKALRMWLPRHRCFSQRVPPGQARQRRHAHRSPATPHPTGPWPAGAFR